MHNFCFDLQTEVKQIFQSTNRILYEEFESWVFKKIMADDLRVDVQILLTLLDKDCRYY